MSTRSTPLHPFSLELDMLNGMLNFEIADDPHYSGLEIQSFDDPKHGTGMLVFLNRRSDGKIDVYLDPDLKSIDRSNYAIGNGLGEWIETEFEECSLSITEMGVNAEARFTDVDGRLIEVRASDQTPRGRRTATFLAPMGAAIAEPKSLPLIWMSEFDLLRRSGPSPIVRIDGRPATLGRLPAEWLTRRRLIKVTSDLCSIAVNPTPAQPDTLKPRSESVDVDDKGTRAVIGEAANHLVRFEFDPPFPDLGQHPESRRGRWSIIIDDKPTISGVWNLTRSENQIVVALDVTEGWRPKGLPLLMKIVTRVAAVFRTWPTTYRWQATISTGDTPTMTSAWERTENDGGESYRALTGSD